MFFRVCFVDTNVGPQTTELWESLKMTFLRTNCMRRVVFRAIKFSFPLTHSVASDRQCMGRVPAALARHPARVCRWQTRLCWRPGARSSQFSESARRSCCPHCGLWRQTWCRWMRRLHRRCSLLLVASSGGFSHSGLYHTWNGKGRVSTASIKVVWR